MTFPEGTTIDKYTLGRCIGKGGMGEVYEAHHTLVGKRCAIKLLHAEMAAHQDIVTRMLREAQAAAAIGHPNIVDTMDFGSTPEGAYYLVMEYLDGESLGELIKRTGAMPIETVVPIALQVLSALEAAHAKGIVHRDLKPDNIFIARGRRGAEEVKLLDFGISKFSSGDDDAMRLTASGMVMGTPYYMSPEQSDGAAHVDARTDIWAMGVILYEALSGTIPFPGNTFSQVVIQVATRDPPPLRTMRPDLPPALELVVNGALVKDTSLRFSDATEMIQALKTACPELAALSDAMSSSPGVLNTGPIPLQQAVAGASPATDPSFVTSETAISDLSLGSQEKPQTAVDRASQAGTVSQAASMPSAGGDAPPDTTQSSGTVAGRQSLIGDTSDRKRKWLIGLGILVGLLAVGGILLYSLDRRPPAPSPKTSVSDSGDNQAGATPDAATIVQPDPMRQTVATAPDPPPTLSIQLVGLPRRAKVTLDGKPTAVPLTLTADGHEHVLEITASRYHPLRHKFIARPNLSSLALKMRRRRGRDPDRASSRTMRPAPRPMQRDPALGDPHRSRPRRPAPRPMRRGGVFTTPYGTGK